MKSLKDKSLWLAALLFTACQNEAGHSHESEKPETENRAADHMAVELTDVQMKVAGIELGHAEMRQINSTVRVTGQLDVPPRSRISVSSPVEGFVALVGSVLPGSRVAKGQLLATVRNPELVGMQQEYLQTVHENAENRAQLEFLDADFRRQSELAKENVNAGKALQQAKSALDGMKARIEGLRAKSGGLAAKLHLLGIDPDKLTAESFVAEVKIHAQEGGLVTEVNVNNGKRVGPTDVLFEIKGTGDLLARLQVFEKDLPRLRAGMPVRLSLVGGDGREFSGKILQIGFEIGADRSVPVYCSVGNLTGATPGGYLRATVEAGGQRVLCVPEGAVQGFDGKSYVFTAAAPGHGGEAGLTHFEMLEVAPGGAAEGFVEVFFPASFDAKTAVVVKGAFDLLAKMKNSDEEGSGHGH